MKAKLKGLSGPAIKGWFITHGEKLALGAAALVFVMLVYKAIGRESLPPDKEPIKLAEKASQATQHVQNSKWDGSGLKPPVYVERAKREDIAALNYKLRSFNRPIYEIKGKRGEPAILAAEGLRVSAGHGILALLPAPADPNAPPVARDPNFGGEGEGATGQARVPGVRAPAGSMPEGRYWAVITGLIPIKKQLGEYQKEFERAKAEDRAADVPVYRGYIIERAEINPSAPDQLNWQPLDKNKPFMARWAITAREVVDAKFVDPNFASPLAPLLGEDWGANVAHPGEIPLLGAAPPPPNPGDNPPPVENPKPDDPFGEFGAAPVKPAPLAEPAALTRFDNRAAEYKLLRFFDFTVEPGKQYRYRVVLGLKNPNHLVPIKYLKKPESNSIELLRSDFSEPTPVVFIPKAEQILAGPKPSDSRVPGETEGTVMLVKFDREKGTFAAKDLRVMRGNVTVYEGNVIVRDPIKNALKEDKIRFDHNALVLDIRGGVNLNGRVKTSTPMEYLLLDADGNITTTGNELLQRTELADAAAYKDRLNSTALPVPTRPGNPIIDLNANAGGNGDGVPSIIPSTPNRARPVPRPATR